MKKKIVPILLSSIIAFSFLAAAVQTSAVSFDSLDADTAVAGVSVLLAGYAESQNTDTASALQNLFGQLSTAGGETETAGISEDDADELYDETKTGIVHVDYSLNIRANASTLSDVAAVVADKTELDIIGEVTVGGQKWYKIAVYGTEGYALAEFITLSDEEKEETESETEETTEAETVSVDANAQSYSVNFTIPSNELSSVSSDVAQKLQYYAQEVRYCMGDHYTEVSSINDVTSMFSAVVYVCDCYQNIIDIASQYGLSDTYSAAVAGLASVKSLRSSLSARSGQSESDLFAAIEAENNAAIEAENAAKAAAAAQAQAEAEAAAAAAQAQAEAAAAAQAAAEEAQRQAAAAQAAAESAAAASAAEAERQAQEAQAAQAAAAAQEAAQAAADAQAAQEAAQQAQAAAQAQAEEAARQNEIAAQCASTTSVPARGDSGATNGTAAAIIAAAESYVGWLPYVWAGASLSSGCDCSGFAANIYAQCGLLNQAWAANHGNYWSGSMRNLGYAVSVSDMQPGDLICYDGHVAIYWGIDAAGNARVIHEPMAGRNCEVGYVNYSKIITVRRLY